MSAFDSKSKTKGMKLHGDKVEEEPSVRIIDNADSSYRMRREETSERKQSRKRKREVDEEAMSGTKRIKLNN